MEIRFRDKMKPSQLPALGQIVSYVLFVIVTESIPAFPLCCQWLSSVASMGLKVSQVKPSNCFRLHSTSMISKHLTILVPDSLSAPGKISFTFLFLIQVPVSEMTYTVSGGTLNSSIPLIQVFHP